MEISVPQNEFFRSLATECTRWRFELVVKVPVPLRGTDRTLASADTAVLRFAEPCSGGLELRAQFGGADGEDNGQLIIDSGVSTSDEAVADMTNCLTSTVESMNKDQG